MSEAYLQAIALVAGYPLQICDRLFDNEGVDVQLDVTKDFGAGATCKSFDVKIQLKHVIKPYILGNGDISRQAEVKTYNKYREAQTGNLHLFVLLVMPSVADAKKWITCTPKQLSIKGVAYYASVYGAGAPTASDKTAVHYKRRNRLTVDRLEKSLQCTLRAA